MDINSQSKFCDVMTRPYKYLSNTLYKTTCTEQNLHLVSPHDTLLVGKHDAMFKVDTLWLEGVMQQLDDLVRGI